MLGLILVIAMITQLAFLSVFGTKGEEVSTIRARQKQEILRSDLLKSEISKQQSLIRVKDVAINELGMVEAEQIEYLKADTHTQANNE